MLEVMALPFLMVTPRPVGRDRPARLSHITKEAFVAQSSVLCSVSDKRELELVISRAVI